MRALPMHLNGRTSTWAARPMHAREGRRGRVRDIYQPGCAGQGLTTTAASSSWPHVVAWSPLRQQLPISGSSPSQAKPCTQGRRRGEDACLPGGTPAASTPSTPMLFGTCSVGSDATATTSSSKNVCPSLPINAPGSRWALCQIQKQRRRLRCRRPNPAACTQPWRPRGST